MTKTTIEWATDVWNPVTGCTKISQGCKNCYAERVANRFWGERKFSDVQLHPERLEYPLHWKKPRRVFVNSMSDLFHPSVPDDFISAVFNRMEIFNTHVFMVLTKRPERMSKFCREFGVTPRLNIWLGVSAENQKAADERIPYLLQTPAAVRFVSCEPLLGPVHIGTDDYSWLSCTSKEEETEGGNIIGGCCEGFDVYGEHYHGVDWVICGGESGPNTRPMHPDWARSLRDQCQAAGVPFFFKQWGEWEWTDVRLEMQRLKNGNPERKLASIKIPGKTDKAWFRWVGKKAAGRLLDGVEWDEYPEAR